MVRRDPNLLNRVQSVVHDSGLLSTEFAGFLGRGGGGTSATANIEGNPATEEHSNQRVSRFGVCFLEFWGTEALV